MNSLLLGAVLCACVLCHVTATPQGPPSCRPAKCGERNCPADWTVVDSDNCCGWECMKTGIANCPDTTNYNCDLDQDEDCTSQSSCPDNTRCCQVPCQEEKKCVYAPPPPNCNGRGKQRFWDRCNWCFCTDSGFMICTLRACVQLHP